MLPEMLLLRSSEAPCAQYSAVQRRVSFFNRLCLQIALRKLGVDLTTSELDGILRIFDADGSGTIAAGST